MVFFFIFSGFRAQFYYDNPAAAKTKRTSKYAASAESESLSASAGNKFQWPSSNWSTDIALLPKVTTEVILGHLLKTGKSTPGDDTVILVQKPLTRGYDFYFGGYIHDVKVCKVDDNTVCVQSLCWASQKKTQKYQQRVSLKEVQSSSSEAEKNASDSDDEVDDSTVPEATSTGEHSRTNSRKWTVVFAECLPCVAGTHGGLCRHIFALLIALEAVDSKAELPGPDSVTSNRQIWGPRSRNVEPRE